MPFLKNAFLISLLLLPALNSQARESWYNPAHALLSSFYEGYIREDTSLDRMELWLKSISLEAENDERSLDEFSEQEIKGFLKAISLRVARLLDGRSRRTKEGLLPMSSPEKLKLMNRSNGFSMESISKDMHPHILLTISTFFSESEAELTKLTTRSDQYGNFLRDLGEYIMPEIGTGPRSNNFYAHMQALRGLDVELLLIDHIKGNFSLPENVRHTLENERFFIIGSLGALAAYMMRFESIFKKHLPPDSNGKTRVGVLFKALSAPFLYHLAHADELSSERRLHFNKNLENMSEVRLSSIWVFGLSTLGSSILIKAFSSADALLPSLATGVIAYFISNLKGAVTAQKQRARFIDFNLRKTERFSCKSFL